MPLAWDGLLTDGSDLVCREGFVPSFTVSDVAQDPSAVGPVEGVIDGEFYLCPALWRVQWQTVPFLGWSLALEVISGIFP